MTTLEQSIIYQKLREHLNRTILTRACWDNHEADFATQTVVHVFGRDAAEWFALAWHEAGDDEIAMKIKSIIKREASK